MESIGGEIESVCRDRNDEIEYHDFEEMKENQFNWTG